MDIDYLKSLEPLFGSWHVVRLIGSGGGGEVYEIERSEFGTVYKEALKVISIPKERSDVKNIMSGGLDYQDTLEYFEGMLNDMIKEFSLMRSVRGNTNIVDYIDHEVIRRKEEIGWDILIRMELLTPLSDHLISNPMGEQDVIKLGIDICKALVVCEKNNIIHRDIKMGNVFITKDGDYKLGDFGIARTMDRASQATTRVCTPQYAAPEVIQGKEYSSNVDTYSLGILMYRILNNNRMPFMPLPPNSILFGDVEKAVKRRVSGEIIPVICGVSDEMNRILLKATSFNPSDRYINAGEFKRDLDELNDRLERTVRLEGEIYPRPEIKLYDDTWEIDSYELDELLKNYQYVEEEDEREKPSCVFVPNDKYKIKVYTFGFLIVATILVFFFGAEFWARKEDPPEKSPDYGRIISENNEVNNLSDNNVKVDSKGSKLLSLEFDIGDLEPTFSPEIKEYTLTIPNGNTEIKPRYSFSGDSVKPEDVICEGFSDLDEGGWAYISFYDDDNKNMLYSFKVKQKDTRVYPEAELKSLTFNGGEIKPKPDFSPDRSFYVIEVDEGTHLINVECSLADPASKVITAMGFKYLHEGGNIACIRIQDKRGDIMKYNILILVGK